MDQLFADHLEQVRAHRADLAESMWALDNALGTPLGASLMWRSRVRAALTELEHDLREHVELTESGAGLYADLQDRAPRLSGLVERQRGEHQEFLVEVDRLLVSGAYAGDGEGHREATNVLLGRLARHRQRGADLIHEAYDVDIGGSG